MSPNEKDSAETVAFICTVCAEQINENNPMDPHHWCCLNESMWSQDPAIQVIAWRLLNRLQSEYWARDLLDMLYLDDQTLAWAKQGIPVEDEDEEAIIHKDINGAILAAGDTVTLVKDLKVKGAGFTAKRGTAVCNISLVQDNAAQIEGRVNSQHIVILTEFVKKAG